MRKVLAILLISLLSLQASWAAAASYCRHEQGAAARHFGHHEHQHDQHQAKPVNQAQGVSVDPLAADAGDDAGTAAASLAGADLDCSVCHAHALVGVPSAPSLPAAAAPVISGAALIQHQPPPVPQSRPERPNWHAA